MTTNISRFVIAIFFVISASIAMIVIFVRSLINQSTELREKNALLNKHKDQLMEQHQLLQALMERSEQQEDEQRRQFSELLHDAIGHRLTLTIIKLTEVSRQLDTYSPVEIKKCIEQQRQALGALLEVVRSLTGQISPQLLYQFGLTTAIESFAAEISREHGCQIRITGELQGLSLDHPYLKLIYKITRELLINALKHADATDIEVVFDNSDTWYEICVSDNGVGFDVQELNNEIGLGFGLFNIRNRLAYYSGQLLLCNNDSGGAYVTVRLPQKMKKREHYEH